MGFLEGLCFSTEPSRESSNSGRAQEIVWERTESLLAEDIVAVLYTSTDNSLMTIPFW